MKRDNKKRKFFLYDRKTNILTQTVISEGYELKDGSYHFFNRRFQTELGSYGWTEKDDVATIPELNFYVIEKQNR